MREHFWHRGFVMEMEKAVPVVVGVYETHVGAEDAAAALKAIGFRDDEIGLTTRDWDGWYQVSLLAGAASLALARNGGYGRSPAAGD